MKKAALCLLILILLAIKSNSQTVNDYDGNVYYTVTIGTQLWIKENLKTTHYNNGVPIPNIKDSIAWPLLSIGARCYYNNDSLTNNVIYGALYNWNVVKDTSKICPSGWHVPTDAEWNVLENYLGGSSIAGGKMKESGFSHWLSPNDGTDNSSGFTGLPGGARGMSNTYQWIGENGLWWTSTSLNSAYSTSRYLWNMYAGIDSNPTPKYIGISIRCISNYKAGIENESPNAHFNVFPNPAKDFVQIETSSGLPLQVQIFNIAGEMILSAQVTGIAKNLCISELKTGIYFLKLSDYSGFEWRKLIKY